MNRLNYLIIALVLLLTFMGCRAEDVANPVPTPVVPDKGPQVKGTFIDGNYGGDGETLNWLLAADATSHSYTGLTIDTLVTYNNELEISLYKNN